MDVSFVLNGMMGDCGGVSLDLKYSTDGGSSKTLLTTFTDPTTYSWDTSSIDSDNVTLYIINPNDPENPGNPVTVGSSSAPFTVDNTAPTAGSGVLTSPVGGETFSGTSSITWNPENFSDNITASGSLNVKLEYSANSGSTYSERVSPS